MFSKTRIYVSCFGVAISVLVLAFQLLTPISITTGLVILFTNTAILFVNLLRYKKATKGK